MIENKKKTTGMVLGKFMPLHRGHELLIHFAANFVDQLYLVTENHAAISGETRCRWLKETAPQAEVFYLKDPMPQAPEEHPDFWNHWRKSLLGVLPQAPDFVIASEQYGAKLAEVLGAEFIPFDLKRESVDISATRIRGGLFENWDYLSSAAKRDYLARICIFGPESSGKSTLTRELAEYFNTSFVPEYARFFIETKGRDIREEDMLHIAQGQLALEEAMVSRASRYLFCDTDPLATTIWSKWLFKNCAPALSDLARQKKYAMYLLTEPDLPWKKDDVRYFPDGGREFFSDCEQALISNDLPYFVIRGHGKERLNNAIRIIEAEQDRLFKL